MSDPFEAQDKLKVRPPKEKSRSLTPPKIRRVRDDNLRKTRWFI